MKRWRGMFPDNFYEVEAESEAQAEAIMMERLAADLRSKEVVPIVWEDNEKRGAVNGSATPGE